MPRAAGPHAARVVAGDPLRRRPFGRPLWDSTTRRPTSARVARVGRVFVSSTLGELAEERAAVRRAIQHSRRIDNRPQMAQALQGLALVDARLGRVDRAEEALAEAIAFVVADRSVTGATYCLEALAAVGRGPRRRRGRRPADRGGAFGAPAARDPRVDRCR